MSQFWSLNDKDTPYVGRAYFKSRTTSIFLLKITRYAMQCAMEEEEDYLWAYSYFVREVVRVELHELLHLFFKYELNRHAYSEKKIKAIEDIFLNILHREHLIDYVNLFSEVYDWMKEPLRT